MYKFKIVYYKIQLIDEFLKSNLYQKFLLVLKILELVIYRYLKIVYNNLITLHFFICWMRLNRLQAAG